MLFSSVSLSGGTHEDKNIALQTILPAPLLPAPPSIPLPDVSLRFVLIYPMHNLFTCVLFLDQQLLKTNEKIRCFIKQVVLKNKGRWCRSPKTTCVLVPEEFKNRPGRKRLGWSGVLFTPPYPQRKGLGCKKPQLTTKDPSTST